MNIMDLAHFSCQADRMCLVSRRSEANYLLLSPQTKLFRVTTNSGNIHYVWYEAADNYEYEFPAACRAFLEDDNMLDEDIFDVKSKQEVKPNEEVFCVNGYTYYLHKEERGDLVIRRICAYPSQQIVEQVIAEDYRDVVIENIYLANFYLLEGDGLKYVLTCWGVVYKRGIVYLPLFTEDWHCLCELSVTSYVREELPVGAVFHAKGLYFQSATDEKEKLYLRYSEIPFAFNKLKSKQKEEPTRIVQFNFKK